MYTLGTHTAHLWLTPKQDSTGRNAKWKKQQAVPPRSEEGPSLNCPWWGGREEGGTEGKMQSAQSPNAEGLTRGWAKCSRRRNNKLCCTALVSRSPPWPRIRISRKMGTRATPSGFLKLLLLRIRVNGLPFDNVCDAKVRLCENVSGCVSSNYMHMFLYFITWLTFNMIL